MMKKIKNILTLTLLIVVILLNVVLSNDFPKRNISPLKYILNNKPKIIQISDILQDQLLSFKETISDSITITKNKDEIKKIDTLLISHFELKQNYPNPFNPATTISFSLKEKAKVVLNVYDVNGREIANLVNGYLRQGNHDIGFNARNLETGLYIYRMKINKTVISKKMMYIK